MKKFLTFLCAFMLVGGMVGSASALVFNSTAGDVDFAADRDAYDVTTNMDFFVFPAGSTATGVATNTLAVIEWGYEMPFEITTANSGSMTVRAWDIDPSDRMDVFFNFGSDRIFAGEVSGSDGGTVTTWESAVSNGTTASLEGWSTTTFAFSDTLLNALSGSTGFNLELDVQNNSEGNWAAVIDYASVTIDYEPGRPNDPVPEPGTILLMGIGLAGLAASRLRRKKN